MSDDDRERLEASVRFVLEAIISERRAHAAQDSIEGMTDLPVKRPKLPRDPAQPVQPGSSGGPLLDERGNLVGVVTSKLNALKTAALTGDFPQNVNFAIKASALTAFLGSNSTD